MKYSYTDVFSHLTYETACIVFMKKDGTVRLMLGTRNLHTIELQYGYKGDELGGHDKRCSINNSNLAVFDTVIGEARQFSIDRLIDIHYFGVIETIADLNEAAERFMEFKRKYEETQPKEISMDMLD